jgi:hypothetical protein
MVGFPQFSHAMTSRGRSVRFYPNALDSSHPASCPLHVHSLFRLPSPFRVRSTFRFCFYVAAGSVPTGILYLSPLYFGRILKVGLWCKSQIYLSLFFFKKKRKEEITSFPTFRFRLSQLYFFVGVFIYSNTCMQVGFLGPCYKTGRLVPFTWPFFFFVFFPFHHIKIEKEKKNKEKNKYYFQYREIKL